MMKTYLLVAVAACSLLAAGVPAAQAAPKAKKSENMEAKMADMFKDKNMRMMAIKELMKDKERMMELAKMLKADPQFREIYGNLTTGGG